MSTIYRFIFICHLVGIGWLTSLVTATDPVQIQPLPPWPTIKPTGVTSTTPITQHVTVASGNSAVFNFSRPAPVRNRFQYQFNYNITAGSTTYLTALHSCSSSCSIIIPGNPYGSGPYLYDVEQSITGQTVSGVFNPRLPFAQSFSQNVGYGDCLCNSTNLANEVWYFRSGAPSIDTDVTAAASVADMCDNHGDELPDGDNNGCQCDAGYFGNQCGSITDTHGSYHIRTYPCCTNELFDLSPIGNLNQNKTIDSSLITPERTLQPQDKVFSFTPGASLNVTGGISYSFKVYNKNASNTACQSWPPYYPFRVYAVAVCDAAQLQTCLNNLVEMQYTSYNYDKQIGIYDSMSDNWNAGQPAELVFDVNLQRTKCGCVNTFSQSFVYNQEISIIGKISTVDPSCAIDVSVTAKQYCLNGGTFYYGKGCACRSGFGGQYCQNVCTSTLGGPNCDVTVHTLTNGVPFTFSSSIYANQTYFSFQSPPPPPNGNQRFLQIHVTGDTNNPTGIRISGKEHCNSITCPIQVPYGMDPSTTYNYPTDSIWPFDYGQHSYSGSTQPVAYATFVQEGTTNPDFMAGISIPAISPRYACGCGSRNASDSSYIENWNILLTHLNVPYLGTLPTNTFTITVTSFDVCNGHGQFNTQDQTCTCDPGYQRGEHLSDTYTSFYTPFCLPCQNSDPSITTPLNCSTEVISVVSTTAGMTMPITQSSGPQLPGQLTPAFATVFPGERAIFKYTTLPNNPRGNPWLFQFRSRTQVKQNLAWYGAYYLFVGGVHTCSTNITCTNLIPNTHPGVDYTWEQDPSQNLIQQPMDIGSYSTTEYNYNPQLLSNFEDVSPVTLDFNPSSYFLRNDSMYEWQYQPVLTGNNTAIPQECLCDLSFYSSQAGSSSTVPTPSIESWTFATSYLSGTTPNRVMMYGNFSDICGGHGYFHSNAFGCQCDAEYFGYGCATPSYAFPYQNPSYGYWVPTIVTPASQCCTGKFTRASTSTIYANGTNGAITTTTTVPINNTGVLIGTDPAAANLNDRYLGLIVYDVDYTYANAGLSFVFQLTQSNASLASDTVANIYPATGGVRIMGFMVCGQWTAADCFNYLTQAGVFSTGNADGAWDGYQYYKMPSSGTYSYCGCKDALTRPSQIMFVITFSDLAIMDITATPPTVDCDPFHGIWNMTGGVGHCVCMNGYEGATCSNRPIRQVGNFQFNNTLTLQLNMPTYVSSFSGVDTPDVNSYATVLSWLSMYDPLVTLHLNLSVGCTTYGPNSPQTKQWAVELMRCYDEPQKYGWNETDQGGYPITFSPQYQTFAYATSSLSSTLAQLAGVGRQYTYAPDNPLRHCDYMSQTFQINRPGNGTNTFTFSNVYGSLGITMTGTDSGTRQTTLLPQDHSPCINPQQVTSQFNIYPDPSCTNSSSYYLIRVVNQNPYATGCSVRMTQSATFTCSDSFLTCGPAASGCQYTNTTGGGGHSVCGQCQNGFEGIGCLATTQSYTEMVNQDKLVFTSYYGEPMRVSLQVSPSNSIALKLTFSTNFNCTTIACQKHRGKVWIRGRVGSHPPTLTTRVVLDESTKTAYVDSDGLDSELLVKPTPIVQISSTGGASQVVSSTTGGVGSGYRGSAYRRLFSREEKSSDSFEFEADVSASGEIELPHREQPHWLYRTLSFLYDTHSPATAPSFEHAYQSFVTAVTSSNATYRNDDLTTDPSITNTINFPSEKQYGDVRVVENAFLYLDIYHSNIMDASSSPNGKLEGGNNAYATNMLVEVVINDTLGTLLGWIAVGILGGFAFVLLVYLIYLRCRYGSISAGVEASVLKKAEVTKEALSPKDQERIARKRAKKRAAQLAKEKEEDRAAGCCKKFLLILPLAIVFVLLLTFEVLKVLFNISILHTSVGSFLPVVNFDRVTQSVSDALTSLGLAKVSAVFERFNDLFDFLGIFNQVSLKWNCGGALSMFAPVVILLGSIVLVVILQKDYFLRFALSIRGSTEGTRRTGRKLRAAIAMVLSTILLYFLQSCILVLTQVVASTWNIKRSCSVNDHTLVYLGRWLCIFFIVMLFYVSGLVFAGIKTFNFQSLVVGWFTGVWALLQLTVGVWRQSTIARFDIAARARAFDIDDNHDQNPEESVMELQAASRGLMWTAFPVGIVLTKVTEQINAPPVFLFGNYLGVDITTPRWNRWLRWVVGMGRMLAVFYTVWSANIRSVLAAFALTALWVLLILILPNDYHKKKWEKSHPVTEQVTTNEFVQSVQLTKI